MSNTCTAPHCDQPRRGFGLYCNKHRIQFQRKGRLTPEREKDPIRVTCMVAECGRAVRARNLCRAHYEQVLADKEVTKIHEKTDCVMEGCDKTAQSKGCCTTHYRQYKAGENFRTADWGKSSKCVEPDCERTSHAAGLCTRHYDQQFTHKSITRAGIPCLICGETRGTNRCHILARRLGGTGDWNNLLPLCATHHWCYDHGELTSEEKSKIPQLKWEILREE